MSLYIRDRRMTEDVWKGNTEFKYLKEVIRQSNAGTMRGMRNLQKMRAVFMFFPLKDVYTFVGSRHFQ